MHLYFLLGMLTITGLAIAILVVLGVVKIYNQDKQITELKHSIELTVNNVMKWNNDFDEHMCRQFDDLRREYSSYVDSRIDKLQAKKEVLKG